MITVVGYTIWVHMTTKSPNGAFLRTEPHMTVDTDCMCYNARPCPREACALSDSSRGTLGFSNITGGGGREERLS